MGCGAGGLADCITGGADFITGRPVRDGPGAARPISRALLGSSRVGFEGAGFERARSALGGSAGPFAAGALIGGAGVAGSRSGSKAPSARSRAAAYAGLP